ncbi:MAG: hypothetical protein Tp1124DCM108671_41 [Prokaryotic dsDNA virus sp.]|nr:MAG: hypothetical protein Tp1125DCM102451_12 [Prokaryotic dsDNA virus sp.]QDP65598.1 MAG: hypothetical protein Tp1124DCM108671_41 [Prokaryotic dsDNA virus sp.]|tara:strand:- start:26110 stop:26412 length:303 start_codon:yes stop_codon:yes gene_type:complete
MKNNINIYEFASWFAEHRPNDFSPIGRLELFEMLTSYEENTGEEIEFDPIAFSCEYTEYEDMEEFWKDYNKEDYPDEQSIMDATFYWAFKNGESFIIQQF